MSIWSEGNTIDTILSQVQSGSIETDVADKFIADKIRRQKARMMMMGIVNKHYSHKSGIKLYRKGN